MSTNLPTNLPANLSTNLPNKKNEYDPSLSAGLRAALREGSDDQYKIVWASPLVPPTQLLIQILNEVSAQAQESNEKYGRTLERMRSNIREGHCQVCTVPFEKEEAEAEANCDVNCNLPDDPSYAAYVLAGCCQIIICEYCVTKSKGKTRQFIDRCPNCAKDISVKSGLIRIGAELDLDSALRDETILTPDKETDAAAAPAVAAAAAVPVAAAAPAHPVEIENPKLRALMKFIKQEQIDCISDNIVPAFVQGLLVGERNNPWPADKPRRILIFAMHPESTRQIAQILEIYGAPYSLLRGARAQKDAAVAEVRDAPGTGILLVTAAKDCAGIHMPWLSHIIFYHRVHDRHVEAQVAARGQRLGRTHNLEIMMIVNEAEMANL